VKNAKVIKCILHSYRSFKDLVTS